jgi:hypothetical protein
MWRDADGAGDVQAAAQTDEQAHALETELAFSTGISSDKEL